MKKNLPKVERLIFKTYLAMIKNSLGAKMFRNFFVITKTGKKIDAMRNGYVSCAFYVSSILTILGLIKRVHGQVDNTLKDMLKSGWYKIKTPVIGAVIVWEKFDVGDGNLREHIGFYVGQKKAISNNWKKRCPIKHSLDYGGQRKVKAIYWHKKLSRE